MNLVKSEFGYATNTFPGHGVGQGKVAPVTAKDESLIQVPPVGLKALQRFLGMVGFYQKFCKNFTAISSPLTDLLSPKKGYLWTEECQIAFKKIKLILSSEPVLQLPNYCRPFTVHNVVCDWGAGEA